MKKQEILRNSETSRLWKAFYASLLIEDIQLEAPESFNQFIYNYENGILCLENIPSDLLRYMNEEYGEIIKISTERCLGNVYTLEKFNEFLAYKGLNIVKEIFYEKVCCDQHEYALILPYNVDEIIVVEGEEERISLPSFSSFVFFHTHPAGECFFSDNDWRSFVEFILNGGFINGVLTNKCTYMLYKVYSISEDDIIRLKDYIDKKEYLKNPFFELRNNDGKTVLKSFRKDVSSLL
jgi:hypothetical protein